MKKLTFLFLAILCSVSHAFAIKETENNEEGNNKTELGTTEKNKISHQPSKLTIASFSIITNLFLSITSRALNVSDGTSLLLFITGNGGLQAWYNSIRKPKGNGTKIKKQFWGFELKTYSKDTHWFTAIPSYVLGSAFAYKIMNLKLKK